MVIAQIYWLVHKDLVSEWRSRRAWPAMILLGIIVAVLFSMQIDVPPQFKHSTAVGMLWLAVFLAASLCLDQSFAAEREDGCWRALRLYPISPTSIYWAKLTVNIIWLATLECVLIPLFVVLADVPLMGGFWRMCLVALLGNVGIASLGSLLSALTMRVQKGAHWLVLLALPMAMPVVLAAAEATRLIADNQSTAAWWDWIGLLAGFATVLVVAGVLLIDVALEE